jgi:hypothetical protein
MVESKKIFGLKTPHTPREDKRDIRDCDCD